MALVVVVTGHCVVAALKAEVSAVMKAEVFLLDTNTVSGVKRTVL